MSNSNREFRNIAVVVQKYRKQANISQRKLAIESGYLNGQFISNVERGLCSMPPKTLPRVFEVLEKHTVIDRQEFFNAMATDYAASIRNLAGESVH